MKRLLLTLTALAIALPAYTFAMARISTATAPSMAPAADQADAIHVDKSDRTLTLLRDGAPIATYTISLGADGDGGHKQAEGDERTPEGTYTIDWRNPNSIAHLSLHISYPDSADQAAAAQAGRDPGGHIMIHGIANGWGWLGRLHLAYDWTNGCIAVTNAEMREIWSLVPNGTPIEIEA